MMDKKGYLFWDSETANPQQRVCQVAYCLTDLESNPTGEKVVSPINPESEFCSWNIRVHGIRPEDVVGAPTFEEFWESNGLEGLLREYVFVSHNAKSADLSHIRKSLAAYNIALPEIEFLDTMQMAIDKGLPGKLVDLCATLGVELRGHHDAAADVIACRDAFWKLAIDAVEPECYAPGEGGSHGGKRIFSGLGLVNRSAKTIEEALEDFDAKGIRGNPLEIDELEGLRVVVTGAVPGYNRDGISTALKNAGVKVAGSVSGKTQYLAIGDNAGQTKLDEAEKLGVPVISVGELLEVLNR